MREIAPRILSMKKRKERKRYMVPRDWYLVEGRKPWIRTLVCCDCGLEHKIEFKKTEKGIAFSMWRKQKTP